MAIVTKISVYSSVKLQTLLFAIAGLIAGILYSFGGAVIDALVTMEVVNTNETPGLSYGTVLAFGALIGMPVIFAAIGLVVGLIEALLYNIFARWFGGLDLDIEQKA